MHAKNEPLNPSNLCRASKRYFRQIRNVEGLTLGRLLKELGRPLEDVDKLLKFADWRIEVKNTTREFAKASRYSYPGRVWLRADTWIFTPHRKLKIVQLANIHCGFTDMRYSGAHSHYRRTMNALHEVIEQLKVAADSSEAVSVLNQAVSIGLIRAVTDAPLNRDKPS